MRQHSQQKNRSQNRENAKERKVSPRKSFMFFLNRVLVLPALSGDLLRGATMLLLRLPNKRLKQSLWQGR